MKIIVFILIGFSLIYGIDIVRDNNTGLTWQDNAYVKNKYETWKDAKDYCSNLSLSENKTWRLPTIKELESIIDTKKRPSIKDGFSNMSNYYYWSINTPDSSHALALSFYTERTTTYPKSDYLSVRCVNSKIIEEEKRIRQKEKKKKAKEDKIARKKKIALQEKKKRKKIQDEKQRKKALKEDLEYKRERIRQEGIRQERIRQKQIRRAKKYGYTTNLSEVYIDENGLVWQDNKAVISKEIEGYKAKKYCKNLSLGGYENWELPSKETLKNLYVSTHDFKYFAKNFYWSSSAENMHDMYSDIYVVFYMESKNSKDRLWNRRYKSNVRCVREKAWYE